MDAVNTAIKLSDQQRLDWLQLIRSENVGPRTFRTLLNYCGGARAALDRLPELARRGGARSFKICARAAAEREFEQASRLKVGFIALGEAEYPTALRQLDDAPPLLLVRGRTAALASPLLAMVGSRNASGAGLKFAGKLAAELGAQGYVIVSGLARGIDAAAHRASLQTGTIAVLAGGHDRIYPAEHESLLTELLEQGAAVTEMPMGWEPRARDFPRRNRLISGLSVGVIVIEAAARSGSLITARFALEQGREVFAAPGSPLDPRAAGANSLLKQGAVLVTEAADIIAVVEPILGIHQRSFQSPGPLQDDDDLAAEEYAPEERARIVQLLGPSPVGMDDLVRLSGCPVSIVRTVLLELELAGLWSGSEGACLRSSEADQSPAWRCASRVSASLRAISRM